MPLRSKEHFLSSARALNFYLDSRASVFPHSFKVCATHSFVLPPARAFLCRECGLPCLHFSSVSESFSVVLSQVCEPVTLEIYRDMS